MWVPQVGDEVRVIRNRCDAKDGQMQDLLPGTVVQCHKVEPQHVIPATSTRPELVGRIIYLTSRGIPFQLPLEDVEPVHSKICTCSLDTLMNQGCQCGAIGAKP